MVFKFGVSVNPYSCFYIKSKHTLIDNNCKFLDEVTF